MPLAEYDAKRLTVEFPGGDFQVRAISIPDVSVLLEVHEYAINTVVTQVRNRKEMFESGDELIVQEAVADLLTGLLREAPILMSNLIAICADERNAMEQASRLPITVQFEALTKIAELTFTDLASVKKLAADVMRLIRGMIPAANARSAN